MKKLFIAKKFILTITVIFLLSLQTVNAQFVEDALRIIKPNSAATARIGALGHSYFGFSDDASAILTNPAGLTLIPNSEIGLGFNYNRNSTSTNFLGNTRDNTKSEVYFSNVQFVMPIFTYGNYPNAKFGFSYNVDNDFAVNTRYSGFNTQNTFIYQQAANREIWTQETRLADNNFNVLVRNNMQQDGFVTENGGLHNLAFGFGVDANEMFSFGGTLLFRFGTYKYNRTLHEADTRNLHTVNNDGFPPRGDIDALEVRERLTQELFGISGIVGMQAKINEMLRLGLSIKFPTLLAATEIFSANYKVTYDPIDNVSNWWRFETGNFTNEYTIVTPFEFTFGLSGHIANAGLSYSVAASFQDASSAYFDYEFGKFDIISIEHFDNLNRAIAEQLTGQFTVGAGLEYKIPNAPVYFRGSYTLVTSPYVDKDFGSNRNIIGAGIGILLSNNLIADAAFSYSSHSERRANYGSLDVPHLFSYYDVTHTPKHFMLGFRYRF